MAHGICRFCGEEKKLIKAHIIPEVFFRKIRDKKGLLYFTSAGRQRASPKGPYDRHILCENCERLFSKCDDYAQNFLLSEFTKEQYQLGSSPFVHETQYEYDLLKLFFIALLWRASVSQHKFYQKVKIDSYEPIAKQFIIEQSPGSKNDFAVFLVKFDHPAAIVCRDPYLSKFDNGTDCCVFQFGGYVAYIKVDSREILEMFNQYVLAPKEPLRMIYSSFVESAEGRMTKKLINI